MTMGIPGGIQGQQHLYYMQQPPQMQPMVVQPMQQMIPHQKMNQHHQPKGHMPMMSNAAAGHNKKPKGRMSAYTFFVQTCREEHRKKHPNENVNFTEFSKKCAERWKQMTDKEKKRFSDMADKDKQRYDREMANYVPVNETGRKRKKKDPNAPKRPLSAFFLFCADERAAVKAQHPGYSVGEVARELGEKWNKVTAEVKSKYEGRVQQEKQRYEKEMDTYRKGGVVASAAAQANNDEGDDDDDDDDEDNE